ncbi:hypothetical protein C0Q70_11818 [Pomacea canaliculata]|uniref:AEBP2-like C-terminal SH3 domain-containing protein n=1 Tax=Pomacea canaliculata TaxID=400727 RepID=A0A2T7P740_POMCA|nr:hypothetical protein C0Q70_11818 [Pomacea canaliculata]
MSESEPGIRNGDFFDCGVMDQLRQQLWDIAHRTQLDLGSGSSQHLTFHSSVIARRMDESGKVNVLLHWHPEDVLDDSWVPLSQVSSLRQRVIPISQLPPSSVANIHPTVYRQHRFLPGFVCNFATVKLVSAGVGVLVDNGVFTHWSNRYACSGKLPALI